MSKPRVQEIKWADSKLDFSNRCAVLGILNVTDDSFSNDGLYSDVDAAVARGVEMVANGADIIDIGAESSRPGSKRVCASKQIERVVPVIERLAVKVDVPISIDTYDAQVAKAALDAGASMINDITAGADEDMFELAAGRSVPLVLMHIKGTPENMQDAPTYDDVVGEVFGFLLERAQKAIDAGVDGSMIILDPGIGFGKTIEHNLALLANLERFVESGYAVLLGASRKWFIGQITGRDVACERVAGTIATSVAAQNAGVQIIRVHDVAENLDAVKMAAKIGQASCLTFDEFEN